MMLELSKSSDLQKADILQICHEGTLLVHLNAVGALPARMFTGVPAFGATQEVAMAAALKCVAGEGLEGLPANAAAFKTATSGSPGTAAELLDELILETMETMGVPVAQQPGHRLQIAAALGAADLPSLPARFFKSMKEARAFLSLAEARGWMVRELTKASAGVIRAAGSEAAALAATAAMDCAVHNRSTFVALLRRAGITPKAEVMSRLQMNKDSVSPWV